MSESPEPGVQSRKFFEQLWSQGDPWELQTSRFEQERYAHLLRVLAGRRYARVLEIGCGVGTFSRQLASIAESVLAIDISPIAIDRARAESDLRNVVFRAANIMDYDVRAEGPWDLLVLAETIYYLGWLYPFFNVGWVASEMFAATAPGGRLLLTNVSGCEGDDLTLPWLIRTYRDLFLNVGYQVEHQEVFRGVKNDVNIEVLTTLLLKPRGQ
jgi:SAM-dependent methyltransferase